MSASPQTFTDVPWTPGTTVQIYRRTSEQHLDNMTPTGETPVQAKQVTSDRSLHLDVLEVGDYWAIAPSPLDPARLQYLLITQQPDPPVIQGPPGPPGPAGSGTGSGIVVTDPGDPAPPVGSEDALWLEVTS